MNGSGEQVDEASQPEKLTVREDSTVKIFEKQHPNGLRNLSGARSSRRSMLLTTPTTMITVSKSKHKLVFKTAVFSKIL